MQLLNTSLIYKYVTDYKSFKNSTRAIRQYMNRTDVYIHIRFPSEL